MSLCWSRACRTLIHAVSRAGARHTAVAAPTRPSWGDGPWRVWGAGPAGGGWVLGGRGIGAPIAKAGWRWPAVMTTRALGTRAEENASRRALRRKEKIKTLDFSRWGPGLHLEKELAFSREEVADVLWRCPLLLQYSTERTADIIAFLREELGLDGEAVKAMVIRAPRVFTIPVATQREVVEFHLKKLGMDRQEAISAIQSDPRRLAYHVENNYLPKFEFFAHEMGMGEEKTARWMATVSPKHILETSLDKTLRPRWEYMRDVVGLREDEIVDGIWWKYNENRFQEIMRKAALVRGRELEVSYSAWRLRHVTDGGQEGIRLTELQREVEAMDLGEWLPGLYLEREIGLERDWVAQNLASYAMMRTQTVAKLEELVAFYEGEVGLDRETVKRMVMRSATVLQTPVARQRALSEQFYQGELGLDGEAVKAIVTKEPSLLTIPVATQREVVEFHMKKLGMDRHEAISAIQSNPWRLGFHVENNYLPKFEFFAHEMGMGEEKTARWMATNCLRQPLNQSLDKRLRPRWEYMRDVVGLREDEILETWWKTNEKDFQEIMRKEAWLRGRDLKVPYSARRLRHVTDGGQKGIRPTELQREVEAMDLGEWLPGLYLEREIGLERDWVAQNLASYPFLRKLTVEKLEELVAFYEGEVGLDRETVKRLVTGSAKLLRVPVARQRALSEQFYQGELGLDGEAVKAMVIRAPRVLTSSVATQREVVEFHMNKLGMDRHEAIRAIQSDPQRLGYHVEKNILPKFEFFAHEVGMGEEKTARWMARTASLSSLLTPSLDKKLRPRWEYMRDVVGLREDEIVEKWWKTNENDFQERMHQLLAQRGGELEVSGEVTSSTWQMRRVNDGGDVVHNVRVRLTKVQREVEAMDLGEWLPGLYLEREIGLERDWVAKSLARHTVLRTLTVEKLEELVAFYEGEVGLDRETVKRMVTCSAYILHIPVARQRALSEQFYQGELGLDGEAVKDIVMRAPRVLTSSVATQREVVEFHLNKLGMDRHEAISAIQSNPWRLGFHVENNYLPKFEFFAHEMGMGEEKTARWMATASFTQILNQSLDKRLRPRWEYLRDVVGLRSDVHTDMILGNSYKWLCASDKLFEERTQRWRLKTSEDGIHEVSCTYREWREQHRG